MQTADASFFRFGRCILRSEISLPPLQALTEEDIHDDMPSQWQFVVTPDALEVQAPIAHSWQDAHGYSSLTLSRDEGGLRLTVAGREFLIDSTGHRIVATSSSKATDSTLEHLLLDQVLPRCLAHDGALILHAAAVVVGGSAVLCLGDSGQGKSTLSAALRSLGFDLLSDDCVQLDTEGAGAARAWPTYPSLRLLPDMMDSLFPGAREHAPMAGYSDKRRLPVAAPPFSEHGVPVSAIYLLGTPHNGESGLRIEAAPPGEALMAVTRNLFKLDPTDLQRARALLAKAAAIIQVTPVFHLRYPRSISALPAFASAIAAHSASVSPVAA